MLKKEVENLKAQVANEKQAKKVIQSANPAAIYSNNSPLSQSRFGLINLHSIADNIGPDDDDMSTAAQLVIHAGKMCEAEDEAVAIASSLKQHYIRQLFQLKQLTRADWKELGAPLGLVATVQHLIEYPSESDRIGGQWKTEKDTRGAIEQLGFIFSSWAQCFTAMDLLMPRDHHLCFKEC